ncbi:MAG TPA: NAD-dependent epimerase/dehydratase family protein [Alphaproteobacteria bacterium]|nr:NAD-dependent epimerase/dehydratase family protein [Alphaproteobacteria bacterium]
MTVIVTGAAGFIGFHVANALLAAGRPVLGVDNVNAYYDPRLKRARLALLEGRPGFRFEGADVAAPGAGAALAALAPDAEAIVHLAAQPGVRHALKEPRAYVDANVAGQLEILEAALRLSRLRHLVYASSSSVYGRSAVPFSVASRADAPASLYAATKRAGELMAAAYGDLHGLPATGLRFFTVYGPWGRPDMAPWIFTAAVAAGRPVRLFGEGALRRDFTYIDDIVAGVLAALDRPPGPGMGPHRLYNLGNSRSEPVRDLVSIIEGVLGRRAEIELAPLPPGDVRETYADIADSRRDLGFDPATPLAEGLPRFVAWWREHGAAFA